MNLLAIALGWQWQDVLAEMEYAICKMWMALW